jgi:hypothetical protein
VCGFGYAVCINITKISSACTLPKPLPGNINNRGAMCDCPLPHQIDAIDILLVTDIDDVIAIVVVVVQSCSHMAEAMSIISSPTRKDPCATQKNSPAQYCPALVRETVALVSCSALHYSSRCTCLVKIKTTIHNLAMARLPGGHHDRGLPNMRTSADLPIGGRPCSSTSMFTQTASKTAYSPMQSNSHLSPHAETARVMPSTIRWIAQSPNLLTLSYLVNPCHDDHLVVCLPSDW